MNAALVVILTVAQQTYLPLSSPSRPARPPLPRRLDDRDRDGDRQRHQLRADPYGFPIGLRVGKSGKQRESALSPARPRSHRRLPRHPRRHARCPGRPARRPASASNAAAPGSTPSTTRSPASGRYSCRAPAATACTSSTRCSTSTPARNRRWSPPTLPPISDIVFGLFRLLGYRFSPRIADMGGTQFWRGRPTGRAARRLRAAERDRPWQGQPRPGPYPLAGHAEGGRVAGHQQGPRLRPDPHDQPGRQTRPRWGRRSPSTAGSTRPCTCWRWSTRSTRATGGGSPGS